MAEPRLIIPTEDPKVPTQHLFNDYRFYALHRAPGSFYFTWSDGPSKTLLGAFHCGLVSPGVYKSPLRGTYGGFTLSAEDESVTTLFVKAVEDKLNESGGKKILIREAPDAHNPTRSKKMHGVLEKLGYRVEYTDLNQAIAIDGKEFEAKLKANNRKRLNKCTREGFAFFQAGIERLAEIYAVIEKNRSSKGHSMSMSQEELLKMDRAFPGHLLLFGATFKGRTVVAAIGLKVSDSIFYVFQWGHLPEYDEFSPVVFLAQGLHRFCTARGFRFLDLGISTENGVPNEGLLRFKEGLGAESSPKRTYVKELGLAR